MPKFSFPHDLTPPELPDFCELGIFPVAVVPYALGALEARATVYTWAEDSYLRGNQLIRSMQMAILCGGMQELTEGQNRIYRLIDSAMYGRVYTVETEEPLVIAPVIPAVPDQTLEPAGLLTMVDALPGIVTPGWFGIGGEKATLADVVKALRVGTPEKATEAIDTFQEMLSAAGNIATVGDLVTDLFSSSVEAVEEGGMLLLMAGGIVGVMAGLQGLSIQLTTLASIERRLVQSLDGGAMVGPDDNVLMALRGITEASESRNVIDAIVAALETITTDSPDVLAKLEEIRALLV